MVRVGSSHLSQKKRSEMETEAALSVVWGTLVGNFRLQEPQPIHTPPLHLQVMGEPNFYLLLALTPKPQQAADGTLPKGLGASSCCSVRRQGRSCGGHKEDLDWLFMELGEPQAREQSNLRIISF